MMTLEAFETLGAWGWIIFGIILCAAELTVPGAFLVWIGFASIAVGVINIAFIIPTVWNLVLFSIFAVGFALIGRMVYGGLETDGEGAKLNQRAQALIGQVFQLDEQIGASGAVGRVRVDDTVWRVRGPTLPAGAQVRVAGVSDDGVTPRVEPL